MANTPNNGIPYVPEGTLDPAAGLNDSLLIIDALLNPRVKGFLTNAPPGSPTDGAAYIIGTAPTGAWAGKANRLAQYVAEGAFWNFYEPSTIGFVIDTSVNPRATYVWNSTTSAWQAAGTQGPKGDTGDTGPMGMPGTTLLTGTATPDTSGVIEIDCEAKQLYTINRDGPVTLAFTNLPPAGSVYVVGLRFIPPVIDSNHGTTAAGDDTVTLPANARWPDGYPITFADGTDATKFDELWALVESDGSWTGYSVERIQ